MTPRATHSIRVLVALLPIMAACTGSTSDTGTSADPEPSLRGTKVQGLSFEQPERWAAHASNWTVSLTWDPVSGPVDHYVVRRDGIVVSDEVESPPFDDDGVAPGNSYRYEVRAFDADGTASRPATPGISERPDVTAGPPWPSLSSAAPPDRRDARLLGDRQDARMPRRAHAEHGRTTPPERGRP